MGREVTTPRASSSTRAWGPGTSRIREGTIGTGPRDTTRLDHWDIPMTNTVIIVIIGQQARSLTVHF